MKSVEIVESGLLLVAPSVGFAEDQRGLWFDKKFVEGMALYQQLWGGETRCLMRRVAKSQLPFGAYFNVDALPFSLTILGSAERISKEHIGCAAVVLAAGDSADQFQLVQIPREKRPPICYVIENSSGTRYRMIALDDGPLMRRMKWLVWTCFTERRRSIALSGADGLQANGVPAYEQYGKRRSNALLYFDTRMKESMLASRSDVDAKAARLRSGAPLRLLFSGRLERIKGVDHLSSVALGLKRRGVVFTMEIFGVGTLAPEIEGQLKAAGLEDQVTLKGAVDFETELIPHVRMSADLFICCHRQSDPSCTYLETYGSGVPVVGYRNAAFEGVQRLSGVGWPTPMDEPDELAEKIRELDENRETIIDHMHAATCFAREHSFEKTFGRRIAHLKSLAGR